MSAPWQVWIDKFWNVCRQTDDGLPPSATRYLRSDLTCGECAECKPMFDWCDAYKISTYRDHPACMEFVPKEGR